MKPWPVALVALIALACAAPAADVNNISDAAQLSAALSQAGSGDTLTLIADITWTGPGGMVIPSGVTLDGAGHTITSTVGSGALLNQNNRTNVVCRNLGLATMVHTGWSIGVTNGDLRLESCVINSRIIAWQGGSIVMDQCDYQMLMPQGSDFAEPIGVYGGGASLTATHCMFRIGWEVQHVATGYFHNYGGSPASRLTLDRCTIIGAPDPNHADGSRHQSVFLSESAAGSSYVTQISNSIIMAEVLNIFRSLGSGQTTSRHNNNAGMLRSPLVMAGGDAAGPRFYAGEAPVQDRTGDIQEPNPFFNAPMGDFRLAYGSLSSTGADDGGPMGAIANVVPREHNAYNLGLENHTLISHRTAGYREAAFDGWRVERQNNQQILLLLDSGACGGAMRMETHRSGGTVTQHAYQTFTVIPGFRYVIRAAARRGAIEPYGTWNDNGSHAEAILGVAEGIAANPNQLLDSVTLAGDEDRWRGGELEVTATSGQLTLHLIHRTNRAWNRVDWDSISIHARAPVGADVPPSLLGPVLGYINHIPAESAQDRTARLALVNQRRNNVPIIVHRGATSFEIENTLEAYGRAMDLGAEGVEFDPRKTRDDVLYTFHDNTVDRMLHGSGRGDEMSYYQIASMPFKSLKGRANQQTRVPTMVSFFEQARQRAMLLHFDVKEWGVEDQLITLLDRFDMWDHLVHVTPADVSNKLRFHPNARLLTYKPTNPNWNNPGQVESFMNGPGNMIFITNDPTPAVNALGRAVPGDHPIPDSLRAWWWPDGAYAPFDSPTVLERGSLIWLD